MAGLHRRSASRPRDERASSRMRLLTAFLRAALIAATLLLTPLAGLVAPAHAQMGSVSGTVVDDAGAPVANAEVQVVGTKLHGPTDEKGHFKIDGVSPGSVTLRALVLGYKPATLTASVSAGVVAEITLRVLRAPIAMQQVEVVVGSRAKHTAADELAVPVDVFHTDVMARQGTTETGQMLQALTPAVNFPHQSVTDATDIVKPFTLRGLSPDQTLVLMNGLRVHQTAVVNTFAYGTPAGSSGVDLNAIPSSAIDRIEVLRDGASAQYGSDAIAGVVNLVTKRGRFAPFVNVSGGQYDSKGYPVDGKTANVNGGVGLGLGRGSLSLFGEVLDREPTNRAWADKYDPGTVDGTPDSVDANGHVVIKNNPLAQPNQHWGDGLEKDFLSLVDFRLPLDSRGHHELYAFGGYSFRRGTGYGYRRYASDDRNWTSIYPLGYLPTYHPDVTDFSASAGWLGESEKWKLDLGTSFGHNDFKYKLENTLNASLGGSLTTPTAPGPDSILGTADDPGIPNQTHFDAGQLKRDDWTTSLNASTEWKTSALPNPVNVALGAQFRYERWAIVAGERASWINGFATNQNGGTAASGSQVFPGFKPSDAVDANRNNTAAYLDLESNLTARLLANVAGRFEHYSDFGSVVTGKLALRYQPTQRVVLRGAVSNGFRAPGLGQIHFSKVVTNFIAGNAVDVGVYPVDSPAARLLGAKPLKEEKSVNLSAGVAVTPADGFTLTTDVYRISITDRILLGATFADSAAVAILAANGYGTIQGLQYFTNGLDTRTDGIDITADWKPALAHERMFNLNLAANFTQNKITRVAPVPAILAGSTATSVLDVITKYALEKERPDWRGTMSATYGQGAAHGLVRVSYYGKFSSAQPGYTDDSVESYSGKTLVDAEAGYKYRQTDFAIGARNLFDTYPDRATKDFNNNFGVFPWAAASPFGYNGRYVYAKASIALTR